MLINHLITTNCNSHLSIYLLLLLGAKDWYENWREKNWLGQSIPPVSDLVEGVYEKQNLESVIDKKGEIIGHERSGQHTVYYVPFSKKKVDEIIDSSDGSNRDGIVFTVKNGQEMRNDKYNYDQFVNLSFVELVDLMITKKGGPTMAAMEQQHQQIQQKQQQEKKQNNN